MEAEVKQVIKEKEYVHDNDRKEYASKGLAGTALGIAIGAGVLSLWGRGRGVGIGGGMPENVNINTVSDAISGRTGVAPTAFQAWEKGCDEALALTNTIWGIKVNTQEQMYNHREIDINEKWQLYKSQVEGDFGNYKVSRDLYDNMNDICVMRMAMWMRIYCLMICFPCFGRWKRCHLVKALSVEP